MSQAGRCNSDSVLLQKALQQRQKEVEQSVRSQPPGCRQRRVFQLTPVPCESHVLDRIGIPFAEVMQSSSGLLIWTNSTHHTCAEHWRPALISAREKKFQHTAQLDWTNETHVQYRLRSSPTSVAAHANLQSWDAVTALRDGFQGH